MACIPSTQGCIVRTLPYLQSRRNPGFPPSFLESMQEVTGEPDFLEFEIPRWQDCVKPEKVSQNWNFFSPRNHPTEIKGFVLLIIEPRDPEGNPCVKHFSPFRCTPSSRLAFGFWPFRPRDCPTRVSFLTRSIQNGRIAFRPPAVQERHLFTRPLRE